MIPEALTLSVILLAGGAGAVGGLFRYLVGVVAIHRWGWKGRRATLTVNLVGAGMAGLAFGAWRGGLLSDAAWFVVGVGFLGAFTTYSTWMLEVARLLRDDARGRALGYLFGAMGVGLLLALLGLLVSG
jgi:fluoride exporter